MILISLLRKCTLERYVGQERAGPFLCPTHWLTLRTPVNYYSKILKIINSRWVWGKEAKIWKAALLGGSPRFFFSFISQLWHEGGPRAKLCSRHRKLSLWVKPPFWQEDWESRSLWEYGWALCVFSFSVLSFPVLTSGRLWWQSCTAQQSDSSTDMPKTGILGPKQCCVWGGKNLIFFSLSFFYFTALKMDPVV